MGGRFAGTYDPPTMGSMRRLLKIISFGAVTLAALACAQTPASSAENSVPTQGMQQTNASAPDSSRETDEANRMRWFPPRFFFGGVFYLPKLTYSEDRGLGAGAHLYYPFRLPGSDASMPACAFRLLGRVTVKGQVDSEIEADLRFGSVWRLRAKLSYVDLAEHFYGIGPATPSSAKEVYRPQRLRSYLEVSRPVIEHLALGARLEYENVLLRDLDPDGQLARIDLRGTARRTVGALGLLASWDSRDNAAFPRHGMLIEGFFLPFHEALGSDYDFDNHNLDLRAYFPLPNGNAFATQLFYYAVRGEPPFWRYASLGGREHTRGYRKDRYLDRTLVAFQGELRFGLFGRLGATAFAGLGDVSPRLSLLELEHMKATVGGGLRVRLGSHDRGATARLDVGFGGPTPELYLTFGEAF